MSKMMGLARLYTQNALRFQNVPFFLFFHIGLIWGNPQFKKKKKISPGKEFELLTLEQQVHGLTKGMQRVADGAATLGIHMVTDGATTPGIHMTSISKVSD